MKSETLRYGEGKKKRKKEREEKREENTFRFDWSGKRLHDRCELETKPFLVRDNTNPGRHCAIKETGIEHRLPFTLSLSLALSPRPRSTVLQAGLPSANAQKWPGPGFWGPASRKILITKYDIMGASPAKHNTMFIQRINRCYEHT